MPSSRSIFISVNKTSRSTITPLAITPTTFLCKIPEGIKWKGYFLLFAITVWPALLPPWKRTTKSEVEARKSMIFPFPSSPH
ncbi:MAG: hypothetical protein ACD_37C00681G0009 [uncultured bacterium]|nr:MAG: hypothetical protein ACD_37C00681G0009 [uncultured bacterium]